jgi:hypothetical protein
MMVDGDVGIKLVEHFSKYSSLQLFLHCVAVVVVLLYPCYQCVVNAVLQHHAISWSTSECFVVYEDLNTCSESAD